ncbi:hypothetical protein NS365_13360 [Aureimonas ureilytica]|uniref:Uncharacterized protein n=1 Tax=Aureimonas ureilytica TaxID=401562 RepID=A0A175RMR1_9HYPH|nr:hypothetical protein [Aureimonas ureilytica]KTR05010.1 hypothetical protein NS365_13360 [Aureimonas ureilytica]
MADIDEQAFQSVLKQFRGGERALAGRRASLLIYSGKKPNTKLLDRFTEELPEIGRYLSNDGITPPAEDNGGNPLAEDAGTVDQGNNASNVSDDQAKDEQAAIDEHVGGEPEDKLNPEAAGVDDGAVKTGKSGRKN